MVRNVAYLLLIVLSLLTGCDTHMLADGTATPPATPSGSVSGVILAPDGAPVLGARVTAYLATVAPLTTVAPLQQAAAYRIASATTEAVTDSQGRFTILAPPEGTVNIEAVYSDALKVFKQSVSVSKQQATILGGLKLQPTGRITGKIQLQDPPSGVSYQGVSIYIPGSSYVAKADALGQYTLANVAPGTFSLAAEKPGTSFGKGNVSGIEVMSNDTVTAPDIIMTLNPPTISALAPPHAGPGAEVTIQGDHFGASTQELLQVTMKGAIVTNPVRVDDKTIRFTVPEDIVSGDVLVTVGGIQSNPTRLRVVDQIRISPKFRGAATVLRDRTQQFRVALTDTEGQAIDDPVVTWQLIEGNSLTVQDGLVTPTANGDTLLQASSGNVFDRVWVHVFEIGSLTLDQSTFHLKIPPAEGTIDESLTTATMSITFQTSDDQDNDWYVGHYLTYQSSDPGVVFKEGDGAAGNVREGVVAIYPGATPGKVTVTVSSDDDPRVVATASVMLEAVTSP